MIAQEGIVNEATDVALQDAIIIQALQSEFHYLVDHGRASECTALFVPDGKMVFGPGSPSPGTLEGAAAIAQFFDRRQAMSDVTSRHVISTPHFERIDASRVAVTTILTVFRMQGAGPHAPDVTLVADMHEIYVRTRDKGWRLELRDVTPVYTRG